ncbi:chromate efflux transporter [Aliiroseovarius sp. F47248L]|uniref:chromate efflux transporter n=1 Tax=Aliiroseovarius sp. F47248L TaxID=2926420 RepID=UPI001FF5CB67|nr:chromate efflux transporter [Aliiroseovarius sp. F47248L]MCK0138469.1 chromate efflux transporter [Aliiroseovarius sp. F47248L]
MTPSLPDLTRIFARIGWMSFGGPAAQIAVMHRELVEDRPWLTERQFLNALSFCMLLPGPEAMQLCTYAGWRLRGVTGGMIAGLLFVLPGAMVMLCLAYAYARWGQVPMVEAVFLGVKAAVVIVVLQALLRLAKKTLQRRAHWAIALTSFVALYAFDAPFPLVILTAACVGMIGMTSHHSAVSPTPSAKVSPYRTLRQAAIWLVLWFAPILLAYNMGAETLTTVGLFFSKLAVVSFGGAYAVLAYMAQEAVTTHGWLSPAQMMDGLGLAETTPGPLILVTEFVGYMAGFGLFGPVLALLTAAMTLWVTFVPCFLWIFTAAPHVEWLTTRPRLTSALDAISAAVVGVIANLSLWFALHVFFNQLTRADTGFAPSLPVISSLNYPAALLAAIAALLLFRLRVSLPLTLLIMAVMGAGLHQLGI